MTYIQPEKIAYVIQEASEAAGISERQLRRAMAAGELRYSFKAAADAASSPKTCAPTREATGSRRSAARQSRRGVNDRVRLAILWPHPAGQCGSDRRRR